MALEKKVKEHKVDEIISRIFNTKPKLSIVQQYVQEIRRKDRSMARAKGYKLKYIG